MNDNLGRRADDSLEIRVVDTEDGLTLTKTEVLELKRLANMARTARMFMAMGIALISVIGLPTILDWIAKHK